MHFDFSDHSLQYIATYQPGELRLVAHDPVFERYGLSAEGLPPIFV